MTKRNRAWRRAQKQLNKSRRIQRCSCWMCGNPRKYCKGCDKYTIQERRQFESEKTYIDPFDDDSYHYYLNWVKWNITDWYADHYDWWYDYISDSKK